MSRSTATGMSILVLTASILAPSCAFEGAEQELQMRYANTNLGFLGTNPMAVGASAALRVSDKMDSDIPITVTAVTSSDPEVIDKESFSSDIIVLGAASAGQITLTVNVERDGSPLSDEFSVRSAEADRLTIEDACQTAEDEELVYLVGRRVDLPFMLFAADTRLAGYGHYPVTLDPPEAGSILDLEEMGFLRLDIAEIGELALQSSIGETRHVLRVVEESDVDAATVENLMEEASTNFWVPLLIESFSGGSRVCYPKMEIEAESLSPEVCQVVERATLEEHHPQYLVMLDRLYPSNDLVVIEPLATGTCEYRIALPTAAGGEGVLVEDSFQVAE